MTNDEYNQQTPPRESGSREPGSQEPYAQEPYSQGSYTQAPPPPPKPDTPAQESPRRKTSSSGSSGSRKKPTDDRVHSSTAETSGRSRSSGGNASGGRSGSGNTRSSSSSGSSTGTKKPKKEKVDLNGIRSTRPAHKVLPYVFLALAFFIAVCLFLNLFCNPHNMCAENPSSHPMGSVGYYLCYGLFGMFGPAVFALPVLLLNMAYFWKTYIDNKLVLEKSIGSCVLLVLISAMIHVFCLAALKEADRSIAAKALIEYGAQMTGGGLIGGGIGYFFVKYLNVFGGIIVSVFLTLLAAFFFLGMTPQHLLERIRTKRNLKRADKIPVGVDDEEYIYRQMEKKHARAAGRVSDPEPETHISDREPPAGAVRIVKQTSHAAHKKPDDGLAPMPMPILDATDDTPTDSPLYVPEDLEKHPKEPAKDAGTASAAAKPAQTAEPAARTTPTTAGSASGTGTSAGSSNSGTSNASATAKPTSGTSGDATRVPPRPAAAPARTVPTDSIDPIFPRSGNDAKTVRKVQKSDRNFELGSIFINLDDHDAPEGRKHAPLPPEVPMPGSAGGSSGEGAGSGIGHAVPSNVRTVAAGQPVPAPTRQAVPGGTAPARTQTPGASPRPVVPGATGSSRPAAPAQAAASGSKPIYRQAEKSNQSDFGLSNEEFEQREAASQSISRAMSAKAQGQASQSGAKPGEAAKPGAQAKPVAQSKPSAPAPEKADQPYVFPPISYLHPGEPMTEENQAEIEENMNRLSTTFSNFNVRIKEITYSCGPTVTRYEIYPDSGVRVKTITNLADDIALAFAVQGVRMETIAGKSAIGVEVPNTTRCTVYLRDLLESRNFTENASRLTAGLGADVTGTPLLFDISKMPHLLVAGTTGSGKSICINCIIMSILFKARPDEVKLILIDPKKVEFSLYKGIPHLMAPIIITPKDAAGALQAAVNEMEDRFSKIQDVGVHDIAGYNKAAAKDPDLAPMPHIVIIIDELADLMMTARDEVEDSICRLAQKARAAGMHIIIGTQRPSVDVVTGLIKSNIPSRIACTVRSQVDSRTILDFAGAEKLLGRGDMLFAPIGSMKPTRVQGAFVSDAEVEKICEFIRATNGTANYNENFTSKMKEFSAQCGNKKGKAEGGDTVLPGGEGGDNKYVEAIRVAIEEKRVSTSLLQRKLGIGYSRAAKIIDRMEEEGLVSKADGAKPRSILISAEQFIERYVEGDAGEDVDV